MSRSSSSSFLLDLVVPGAFVVVAAGCAARVFGKEESREEKMHRVASIASCSRLSGGTNGVVAVIVVVVVVVGSFPFGVVDKRLANLQTPSRVDGVEDDTNRLESGLRPTQT